MARPGFLWSVWPWRAVVYLGSGVVAGVVVLVVVLAGVIGGSVLAGVLVGIPLLVFTALAGIPVAVAERYRLRLVDRHPVPGPHGEPDRPGLRGWLTTRLREQWTWRELAYTLLVAQGRSNGAIARELVVTEAAVGKHIGSILAKLDLPPADDVHRRVLAVLTYLRT
nr:sensor domain-containing protein [Streptomyces sp. NBC_00886]